jgi:alkylation response protein AidB-like acyl-CoA dehydrogenase
MRVPVHDRRHEGAGLDRAAGLLPGGGEAAARRAVQAGASIAKLYSSETAMENARYATQVHGGYGFMNEFPVGASTGTRRS